MKTVDIFDKKNIELFMYGGDGIEFLDRVLFSIGYTYHNDISSFEAREKALSAIEQLLRQKIIYVYHWGNDNDFFKKQDFTISETILIIRAKWLKKMDVSDLSGIIILGLQKWYVKALEELGMTYTTDWDWFVENKIGDLKQCIEENKPHHQ